MLILLTRYAIQMKMITTLVAISSFSSVMFAHDIDSLIADGINVHTTKKLLQICEHGIIVKEFNVSFGRKGVGKKQIGDKKTPLGLYELESPRESNRFGIFIPIKYPTEQQLAVGYTGKDVGIHGPFQLFSWLGSLNTTFNWTQGCIAVGKNEQIKFIANWVKTHPQTKISVT